MSTATLTMTPTTVNGHNNHSQPSTLKRHLTESDPNSTDDHSKSKKRKITSKSSPTAVKAQRIVYRPHENLFDVFQPGKLVKVFIPLKYLIVSDTERKVWGTDIYTDDSDLIAACQHVGKLKLSDLLNTGDAKNGVASTLESQQQSNGNGAASSSQAPSSNGTVTTSNVKGVIVSVKIQHPLRKYNSTFRNNIRSRSWNFYNGNAYTIESLKIVRDLPKNKDGSKAEKVSTKKASVRNDVAESEHKRFLPNVTVVYNLCNEPCLKYSLNMIADRGYSYNDYTSHRLRKEVIYLENQSTRYELCQINRANNDSGETSTAAANEQALSDARYRWARVLNPLMMTSAVMHSTHSVPLAPEHLEVLHDDLRWNELQWGIQSVTIRGNTFFINNIKFVPCSEPTAATSNGSVATAQQSAEPKHESTEAGVHSTGGLSEREAMQVRDVSPRD